MKYPIPPEKMAVYRRTHRQRLAEERRRQAERRARAMALARKAAGMLRRRYGVRSVVLFGSLARGEAFDHRSDVDLAVTGLAERDYLRALAHLLDLDMEIDVDLVMLETARPTLAANIAAEGIPL